uniref:DUF4105 domain-containing protein n=1 Tax=Amphora coffeiformis TaxID=265554 RepID=A0A7S3L5A7_9STRA|mmetsp:Transcript_9448/g.19056  ORF Transcript_9448/g.19056 Transcript_9448/m.19056 type:complete len:171 (-) Transcript_9448:146-658(-)|eukprot:scaffold1055_cov165-Amphora_coffeaeformis.AAC.15
MQQLVVAFLLVLLIPSCTVHLVESAFWDITSEKRRPSFKVMDLSNGSEVRFRPSPLIGGPQWLPLHVKLILRNVDDGSRYVLYDFIPLDATDKEVLARLTTFQNVPGEIRSTIVGSTKLATHSTISLLDDDLVYQRAQEYCENYPRELNLLTNNCWTFAIGLAAHLSENQ